MACNSRPCREAQAQGSTARQVLLTWARSREYKDLAITYLQLANSASNRNIRDRYILVARHYWTLADAERRVADEAWPPYRHSQDGHGFGLTGSFPSVLVVLLFLISVAFTTFPFNFAHAEDCLAAPSGPAPQGKHWYYHLNRATQHKCWYVRTPGTQAQHAGTAQTISGDSAPIPASRSPIAPTGTDAIVQSPRAKASLVKPAPVPTLEAPRDDASSGNPAEEMTAPAPEASSQQSRTFESSGVTTAPPPMVRPDPPVAAAVIMSREASAAPGDVHVNLVSEDPVARSGEQANNFGLPIIVFPALALGLVVMGIGSRVVVRNAALHRVRVTDSAQASAAAAESPAEQLPSRYERGLVREEQELHSFITALSDRGPFAATSSANKLSDEIRIRQAKLARLRNDIDQILRTP
jgi:hypothetical protein